MGATVRVIMGCVLFAVAFQSSAGAQDFQWQANAYNDESNKGKYTAFLTQGVPETDNVAFRSTCTPGSSATFAATVFVYNTGNLERNTDVQLSFFVNGKRVHRMPGLVYHAEQEEGVSGVFVRAEVDDPIWGVLSRNSFVHYEANGMGQASMNLSGSSRAIDTFLADCRGIFGMQVVDDRDNEENNVAEAKSCRQFGNIRSKNSNQALSVRFTNKTSSYRSVMWLDYSGTPVHYKDLDAGESYVQQTFAGHPWMFTDGPGNCKEVFVPKRGSTSFEMTFDR